jgi:hypothetical protein
MLDEILKAHIDHNVSYDTKKNKLEKTLERAEKSLKKVRDSYKGWVKTFVEPLAKELQKRFPEYEEFELLGPFGLRSSVSIHFFKRKMESLQKEFGRDAGYNMYFKDDNLISITIVPRYITEGVFAYETNKEKTEIYPANSIGDVNGFGNATEEITNIEDLVTHLQKQVDKGEGL